MGIIQDILKKFKEKKEERKSYERGRRIEEGYEEKKLSANERELLKFKNIEREKKIKKVLDNYRKKEKDEIWRGKKSNPIYAPNIIKDNKNLFKGKSLFMGKGNLFKNKNMFMRK